MGGNCTLCPRECKTDREASSGFCRARLLPTVAKWMLHLWEEPCICEEPGSGAVFFSGCQLQCIFCQNYAISCQVRGKSMDRYALSDLFLTLEERGACNINLISPTPHLHEVIPALEIAKGKGLSLPIVFNSGGYEKEETIVSLRGLVDIYLPDYKFFSPELAKEFAGAENYPEVCRTALLAMYRQVGDPLWENDKLKKGLLIRHLILPGCSHDSVQVIRSLSRLFSQGSIVLSLMRQYIPMHKAVGHPMLSRTVTELEYQRVVKAAEEAGFDFLFTQKKESAKKDFVPDFTSFDEKND